MPEFFFIRRSNPTTPVIGSNPVINVNPTIVSSPTLVINPTVNSPLYPNPYALNPAVIVDSDPGLTSDPAPIVTTTPTGQTLTQTETERNSKVFAYSGLISYVSGRSGQDWETLRAILSREYTRLIDSPTVSVEDINYIKAVTQNLDAYAKGYPLALLVGELVDALIRGYEPTQALQFAKNAVDGNQYITTPGDPAPIQGTDATPTGTPSTKVEYGKIAATVIIGFLFKQAVESL
ncbi:hypothetical protein [Salmonirosea aquatica]|uniref:Uncharacterized protein n=1 Tax=Salmonirosea aquatica TaxID=2654236 RepID=A0A7C9FS72_9BACT|nr:hypothetical protein [Cytophagaceae bacterium SJW1-29]MPR37149.1 hypothetical protein [Cytophagaceae bacterium SJW1-29]